jgi:hypothetical protein
MAYMIYQQVTTAVKEAYAADEELATLHLQAQACVRFLESLPIDAGLRGPIVEPVAAVEEAFRELLAAQARAR